MSDWKCKKHSLRAHDVFINYRVKTEANLAQKLYYALSTEEKSDGKTIIPYLDVMCLNDGEDWEVGFLNGLENAALLILLISEDGIDGIKNAHKWQDNVLLEYEYALEKNEKKQALILPLLVGKNVENGLYKPFGAFNTSVYPEEKHGSDRSSKSVRETMNRLFKLQGVKTNPDFFQDKMRDIVKKVEEALTLVGRLGAHKSLASGKLAFKEKTVLEWSVGDVQEWLKDLGFEAYQESFKTSAVDGPLLLDLSKEDLEKELKITSSLHLKKFATRVEELRHPKSPTSPTSPTSPSSETKEKVVSLASSGSSLTSSVVSRLVARPAIIGKGVKETWEGRWSSGWSHAVAFEWNKEPRLIISKVGTGQVEICSLQEGKEPATLGKVSWSKGWDVWVTFEKKGQYHYLIAKSGDGRVETGTFDKTGTNFVTLKEEKWSPGWTNFTAYEYEGTTYIAHYKTGSGEIGVSSVGDDGALKEVWKGKWSAGWTNWAPYKSLEGKPFCVISKVAEGRIETIQFTGGEPKDVWRGSWSAGWSHFMPLTLQGHPFVLIYKIKEGRVEICSINQSGYVDDDWTGSWSAGWSAFAPFYLDGRQYYFMIKTDYGNCEVSRIQYA